mmetsp:Transcript_8745/g.8300  ORF Transcript_8745/g.8300 Transcript_8745/m.8300 type:complete len:98 (-) Transcript_8745:97-390(-)
MSTVKKKQFSSLYHHKQPSHLLSISQILPNLLQTRHHSKSNLFKVHYLYQNSFQKFLQDLNLVKAPSHKNTSQISPKKPMTRRPSGIMAEKPHKPYR